ncbi:MAG: hypothetical protein ACREA0_33480 [bacterium]
MERPTAIRKEGLSTLGCAFTLDDAIKILTRRIDWLCELTTQVYGPPTSVSRDFCFADIGHKRLILQAF